MPFFTPTQNKNLDLTWDAFVRNGLPTATLPDFDFFSTTTSELSKLQQEVNRQAREPAYPFPILGNSPVGEPLITIPEQRTEAIAVATVHYLGLRVLSSLEEVFQRYRSVTSAVYAGYAAESNSKRAVISCWIHFSDDVRMLFSPKITHTGGAIGISWSHVILWRQPFLNSHPDTHSWWLSLASPEESHFNGGLYAYAMSCIGGNRTTYDVRKWLLPRFFTSGGQYKVFHSERHSSVYLFSVGELPFDQASVQGLIQRELTQQLEQLRHSLEETFPDSRNDM